ncbi:MAG: 23S rRNA pseudouridine(2604) synthase RluF [Flavobacteriales bacterium]|nr:23S rRNA pseudouridine(2604) synthase RluF [Flavobacteriales bacterium]
MNKQLVRLNKFLSELGYCSRREADKLIEQERVTVNGLIPKTGTKVSIDDEVVVDGEYVNKPKKIAERFVYIAFNKPRGIVCTTDSKSEKNNIVDYINHKKRIFPIGRLDKPSEGLIFLTNDGDIVNKILRSKNNHEKEYIVTVDKPINSTFIKKMSDGVPILGTKTKRCKVEKINQYKFKIVLTEGMNRQIRRMCEFLDYKVKSLQRVRIMNVKLDVGIGKWRDLTDQEITQIKQMVSSSAKTK